MKIKEEISDSDQVKIVKLLIQAIFEANQEDWMNTSKDLRKALLSITGESKKGGWLW